MKQSHTNINACIYDNTSSIDYDCIGVAVCKFALCSIMPPTGDEQCTYNNYKCDCASAQLAALKELQKTINKAIKELEENEE